MKCPKYIEDLCKKRAKHAAKFMECDCEIAEWLEKHNLLSEVEDYDILTGCESIVNPNASSKRIIAVIKNA